MESFLIKAAQMIVALSLLVAVHEFGHYIFARIFGMRVDRFYLFFNPWFSLMKYFPDKGKLQIIAWTRKVKTADGKEDEEPRALVTINAGKKHPAMKNGKATWASTLYGLGWLPLGGYCSISGMVDETTSSDQLASEPEPWEFRAKKPVPRLMVMLAGVIFNFLTAIIIYIGIDMYWGESAIPFQKAYEGMDFSQEMQTLGLKNGDILLEINGKTADALDDEIYHKMVQDGTIITVLRNHRDTLSVTVPDGFIKKVIEKQTVPMSYRVPVVVAQTMPGEGAQKAGLQEGDRIMAVGADSTRALSEFYPALKANSGKSPVLTVLRDGKEIKMPCAVNSAGKIGIMLTEPAELFEVQQVKYNLWTAIPHGVMNGTNKLVAYAKSLKLLFSREGAQSVGGFGTIGSIFPDHWNWYSFWNICAFLSVILAFMNILPIPALDGGHVMFTLWEIVSGRKPSMKVLEYAQMAGMAFLFLLLVYANGNDIYRFFFK